MTLLSQLYEQLGDRISLQYGGSEAHKKVTQQHRKLGGGSSAEDGKAAGASGGSELLTSLKRYYANVTKDALKQVQH